MNYMNKPQIRIITRELTPHYYLSKTKYFKSVIGFKYADHTVDILLKRFDYPVIIT